MFYRDGFFGGMHFVLSVVWLVLLVWIFFTTSITSYQVTEEDNLLETLKRSFAKGEITMEDYEQSKKLLGLDS